MPVTIYCQNFDCSERVTASGEVLYRDDGSLLSFDVSMTAYVPIAWLKRAFKYKSKPEAHLALLSPYQF